MRIHSNIATIAAKEKWSNSNKQNTIITRKEAFLKYQTTDYYILCDPFITHFNYLWKYLLVFIALILSE